MPHSAFVNTTWQDDIDSDECLARMQVVVSCLMLILCSNNGAAEIMARGSIDCNCSTMLLNAVGCQMMAIGNEKVSQAPYY
eukprot:453484-Amphidinium_carterae.2